MPAQGGHQAEIIKHDRPQIIDTNLYLFQTVLNECLCRSKLLMGFRDIAATLPSASLN